MEFLIDELYGEIELGKKVKCPEKDCSGNIVKVCERIYDQYSEVYWEKIIFYRCTRNCKHIWKYVTNSLRDLKENA